MKIENHKVFRFACSRALEKAMRIKLHEASAWFWYSVAYTC